MAETMTMRIKKKDELEAIRRQEFSEKREKRLTEAIRKVKREEFLKEREEKRLNEIRDDDVIEPKKYLFDYGKPLTRNQLIADLMSGMLQTDVMSDEDRMEYRQIMRDAYGHGEGVGGPKLGK